MQSVFITGAARGIGLAIARRFAREGYFVGIWDLNEKRITELLNSGEFPQACGGGCDVTSRASIDAALQVFAKASGGRLDVLVNNAGVLTSGEFKDIDPGLHDLMIDVNVRGLTTVCQAAHPLLNDTPGAVVINLCSASSIHGIPLLAVYSATKFYVNGLTEALEIEWAEDDIRLIAIKPPPVNTAMGNALNPKLTGKVSVSVEPEDVADTVYKALQGRGSSHIIGFTSKLWALLDRWLPEALRRAFTRYVTNY
jgi:NAD(P)-dependent dehydrogenase (short-subunit alcohol dehydrogenase family)